MYIVIGPWPPQHTAAAGLARDLVRYGGEPAGLVTLAPDPVLGGAVFPLDADDPARWPGQRRLYHFDDHPDHAFAVELFLRAPGVVALHAPALRRLAQAADAHLPGFLDRQSGDAANAGPDALRPIGRAGLDRRGDSFDLPCLAWLAEAPAIIVASQAARRRVTAALPGVPLHLIAHPVKTLGREEAAAARIQARAALRLAPEAYAIAVPGQPIPSAISEIAHAAAYAAGRTGRAASLVLAPHPRAADVARLVHDAGAGLVLADPFDFDLAVAAADVLVAGADPYDTDLRILHQAQGRGVAVVTVGHVFADDMPGSCCLSVEGLGQLGPMLGWLGENDGLFDAMRDAGRALVEAVARPATVARSYLEVVHGA